LQRIAATDYRLHLPLKGSILEKSICNTRAKGQQSTFDDSLLQSKMLKRLSPLEVTGYACVPITLDKYTGVKKVKRSSVANNAPSKRRTVSNAAIVSGIFVFVVSFLHREP
jgi:hypothetical protein